MERAISHYKMIKRSLPNLDCGEIIDACLGKNCCMHFKPRRGLQIQVLEHFTRQGTCWRKGFLTNDGTVVPWGEEGGPYVYPYV